MNYLYFLGYLALAGISFLFLATAQVLLMAH